MLELYRYTTLLQIYFSLFSIVMTDSYAQENWKLLLPFYCIPLPKKIHLDVAVVQTKGAAVVYSKGCQGQKENNFSGKYREMLAPVAFFFSSSCMSFT